MFCIVLPHPGKEAKGLAKGFASNEIFYQSSMQPLTLNEGHPTEDEEADIRDLEVGDLNDMESDAPQPKDLQG